MSFATTPLRRTSYHPHEKRKKAKSVTMPQEFSLAPKLPPPSEEILTGKRSSVSTKGRKSADLSDSFPLVSRETKRQQTRQPNDIGIIIAEKLKKLKVEVLPTGTRLFVVVPQNSTALVSEIEDCLRSRLENPVQDAPIFDETYHSTYNTFRIHINGAPIPSHEILSLRWNDAKRITFQPEQQFDSVVPRKFLRTSGKHRPKKATEVQSLAPPTKNNVDAMKDEISNLHERIEKLEKANNELKSRSTLHPQEIQEIRTLGTGATAVVKSCYVNGWICAMKEIDMRDIDNSEETGELSLLEKLPPHRNFVQYFFHKIHEHSLQIFMKQYSGTLLDLIKKQKHENSKFSPEEIIGILKDIASGLAFLHNNNVIHRDMKSDNIFVQSCSNGSLICAIGDLDTAKLVSKSSKAMTTVGTCAFIAPEVLQSANSHAYSSKADIFSFGMITFELLALKLPYLEIKKSWLISKAIVDGVLPQLPVLGEEYGELVDLFTVCVATNPNSRPKASVILSKLQLMEKSLEH